VSGPFVLQDEPETDEVKVPCVCVNKPHEEDTVYILHELNGEILSATASAFMAMSEEGTLSPDPGGSDRLLMQLGVVGWTFVDGAGTPIQYNPELVNSLRASVWNKVKEALAEKENEGRENPTSDGKPTPTISGRVASLSRRGQRRSSRS
jgi:hypothetical protein